MLESCHFKRPANVEIDLKYGICTQFFVFVILIKSKFTAFDGLIFQASYLMWVRERGKNLRSLFDQYVFKFVCTHRQTADALLYVCTATNKKNGEIFVLNSYKDKLYTNKMLGFSKEIDCHHHH